MKFFSSKTKNFLIKNYLFLITFLVITFFNFYSLPGDLFNADQHFWFQRTTNFVKAIQNGEFDKTFQNPKPGVTIMILSGASLETFLTLYQLRYNFRPLIFTQDTYGYIDFSVKAPLVILGLVSFVFLYVYLKKLFDEKIALFSLILLGLSPYYTAMNRLFHGDGTMNSFFLICILLLVYFFLTQKFKFLIYSAIAGGCAFLAKSQAIFLVPYIFLISGLGFLILKRNLKDSIKTVLIWLGTFSLTIYILFPAMWEQPIKTFSKIFDEGLIVASEGRNFEQGENNYFYYFNSLYWTNNIILQVLFFVGIGLFFYNYKKLKKDHIFIFLSFISIIIFYFLQMTLVVQKSDRYISVLTPYIVIFAAYTLSLIKVDFKKLSFSLLIISIIYISYFAPYYLALYEKDNWGSLTREVANYLNSKNNPQNLNVVMSPKDHTLRPLFKGKVYNIGEGIPKNNIPDYIVLGNLEELPLKYNFCIYDKSIEFREKLFWQIYICNKQ
jgi:4-amino-4-deoxy-L-arabinose transferase-like glycosyltransferase